MPLPPNGAERGKGLTDPALPVLELCIPSSKEAVRGILITLGEVLASLEAIPDDLATLEIVLGEALNNIVEHAYPPHHPGGVICIRCVAALTRFDVTVTDRGLPMPGGAPPAGGLHNLDVAAAELPEGGFGWHLIRSLSQTVHYERLAGQNRLNLSIARIADRC